MVMPIFLAASISLYTLHAPCQRATRLGALPPHGVWHHALVRASAHSGALRRALRGAAAWTPPEDHAGMLAHANMPAWRMGREAA
jgi:hypothetical protein